MKFISHKTFWHDSSIQFNMWSIQGIHKSKLCKKFSAKICNIYYSQPKWGLITHYKIHVVVVVTNKLSAISAVFVRILLCA